MLSASRSIRQDDIRPTRGRAELCSPEVEFAPDGIVFVRWPADAAIEEPDALAVIARIEKLSGDQPKPILVDIHGMRSVSSGALTEFARRVPTTRMALVGSSPVEQTIVQFFHAVHRPSYPATYFTRDSDALEWLTDGRYGTTPMAAPRPQKRPAASYAVAGGTVSTRRFRFNKALAGLFGSAVEPQWGPSSLISRPGADDFVSETPVRVSAETLDLVTAAFRGRTGVKAFPMAVAVAEVLDGAGVMALVEVIGRCAPAERGLITTHLYRHYRRAPAKLALWVTTAERTYFHARVRVVNSGIRRARLNPGKITAARLIDRDSAGHNVRQEIRDAISIVNGLVHSPWPGQVGIGSLRNIASLGASLARLLVTEGDRHGLAGCYREYTDIYDARYSVVEEGTGLIDFVLKHPEATGLLCEYIQGGKYASPEALLLAVTSSARFLRYLEELRTANGNRQSSAA